MSHYSRAFRLPSIVLFLMVGCAVEEVAPKPQYAAFDDLSVDAAKEFQELRMVGDVHRTGPEGATPTQRIIHICSTPVELRETLAEPIESPSTDSSDGESSATDLASRLEYVETVQQQQTDLIREILKRGTVRRIYVSKSAVGDESEIETHVKELKGIEKQLEKDREAFDELMLAKATGSESDETRSRIKSLEDRYFTKLLALGVGFQFKFRGEIEELVPIAGDDSGSLETAIVETLLKDGPTSFLVLDEAYSLAEAVESLSQGQAEYIRVKVQAFNSAPASVTSGE